MIRTFLTALLLCLASISPLQAGADADTSTAASWRGNTPLIPPAPDDPLAEGIIRITLQGLASTPFIVRFDGDSLYVPFLQLCDFLRIATTLSPDGMQVSGELLNSRFFELATETGRASLGSDSIEFDRDLARPLDGDIYIETSLLSRWLKLSIRYDTVELMLIVAADERIPRVQLSRDRRKYASLSRFTDPLASWPAASIERQFLGYPAADWYLAGSSGARSENVRGSVTAGMPFLFGLLNLSGSGLYNGRDTSSSSISFHRWNWQYFMPEQSALRRIIVSGDRIGDRYHYSLELSNGPLSAPADYAVEEVTGYSQPGWTVELHEAGRLLEVTTADSTGLYRFLVPVGQGTTDRTIIQVSRHGERFLEERRLERSPQLVPAGEILYRTRLTAADLAGSLPFAGEAGIGYGISNRITVGADAVLQAGDVGRIGIDSLSPALSTTFWLGDGGTLGLRYNFRRNVIQGAFNWLSSDNTSIRLGIDSLSPQDLSFISTGTISIQSGRFLWGGTGRYAQTAGVRLIQFVPRISGYLGGMSFTASTDLKWNGLGFGIDELAPIDALYKQSVLGTLQIYGPVVRGLLFSARGTYDYLERQISSLAVTTSYRFSRMTAANVSYSVAGTKLASPLLQLQVRLDLNNAANVVLSGDYSEEQVTTSAYLQGAAFSSASGVHFLRHSYVGQTAIEVRSFSDDNGNGQRDDGEIDLGGIPAKMSSSNGQTRSDNGWFLSIPGNRECLVEIDAWVMASRDLFPRQKIFPIYTHPGAVHIIDVPFAPGFDVGGSGVVVADDGVTPIRASSLMGLSIQLLSADGAGGYDGEIFHDGSILATGVAAGEYRIVFDERQLASRRLRIQSIPDRITLGPTNRSLPRIVFAVMK